MSDSTSGANIGVLPFGIQVNNWSADADDMDPRLNPHQDWMAYGAIKSGSPTIVEKLGSDALDVKSMRKLDELEQTIWLCLGGLAGNTTVLRFTSSVLLLMP